MSKLRNYCRLAANYYEDDVLLAAADECAAAMHLWPILVAKAKASSHRDDNPDGVIRTTVAKLARDAYVAVDDVRAALDALDSGELVTCSIEGTNRLRIVVSNFAKWQNANKSDADMKDAQRANASRQKAAISPPAVQSVSSTCPLEREEEGEEDKGTTSLVRQDRTEQIQNVFDYWCKVERETGGLGAPPSGRRPKLTKERRAKINARLAEGYSAAELKMAIAFYARDPHHLGETTGTRYTDLKTTMKAGSKVEAGVAGYEARGAGTAVTTNGVNVNEFVRSLGGAA